MRTGHEVRGRRSAQPAAHGWLHSRAFRKHSPLRVGHQGWTGQEETFSHRLCPQLACQPGPAAPLLPGSLPSSPLSYFVCAALSSAALPKCASFILPSPPCRAAVTTVQQEPGWRPPSPAPDLTEEGASPLVMCLPSTHLALPVVQSHRMMLPQDHPPSPLSSCPAPAHQPCSKRAPAATAQQ